MKSREEKMQDKMLKKMTPDERRAYEDQEKRSLTLGKIEDSVKKMSQQCDTLKAEYIAAMQSYNETLADFKRGRIPRQVARARLADSKKKINNYNQLLYIREDNIKMLMRHSDSIKRNVGSIGDIIEDMARPLADEVGIEMPQTEDFSTYLTVLLDKITTRSSEVFIGGDQAIMEEVDADLESAVSEKSPRETTSEVETVDLTRQIDELLSNKQ